MIIDRKTAANFGKIANKVRIGNFCGKEIQQKRKISLSDTPKSVKTHFEILSNIFTL